MANIATYKINYKSDFVLTLHSDVGWATPFCIKFWTGSPQQAYYVGWTGDEYRNCKVSTDDPQDLLVLFDDHGLQVGELKMQMAYHTTIADFPNAVIDEVLNQIPVTTIDDDTEKRVVLDFDGESAPEIQFALPAYAAEAARQAAEAERERIFAQMQRENQQAVEGAERVNATLNGTLLTVTNRNGVSTSSNVQGRQGDDGKSATVKVGTVVSGSTAEVTNIGTQYDAVFNFVLPKGEDGVGIVSITYKDTDAQGGNVYTILLDNGHSYDITCPKGDPSTADINLNGSIISVTNNAGVTKSIDVLSSTDERVQITVTTDVPGVSVAGLTINAYYNNATVPTATCTTDANGMAVLSVPNGYKYRLVFPSIQGCAPIADVVHTASVSQRSVEVEYEEAVSSGEVVSVAITEKSGSSYVASASVTIEVSYGGNTYQYVTGSDGKTSFQVPWGTNYTVTLPLRQGLYLMTAMRIRTFYASQTSRVLSYRYQSADSGLYIVCSSDGAELTPEQWDAQGRSNSDAVAIKVVTQALVDAGGVFAVPVDPIATNNYQSRQWAASNVQFMNIPLNGNSSSSQYYYDGLNASKVIQDEGDARSINTPAVDYCLGLTLETGGITHEGFLGSVGQYAVLWANVSAFDDILSVIRPGGSLLSKKTDYKWTSAQNDNTAFIWGSYATNSGKYSSYVVLPFFAY